MTQTYFDVEAGVWRAYAGDAWGKGATEAEAIDDLGATLNRMQQDDIREGDRSRAA